MVDFNTEGTVATPLYDVLKLIIVEQRYNVLQAIKLHFNKVIAGKKEATGTIRSEIICLFYTLQNMLMNEYGNLKESKYTLIKTKCFSININDLLAVFEDLEKFMYEKEITKIDTKRRYDQTNMEYENNIKGL